MPQAIAGPIALAAFNAGAPLVVANAIVGVGVAGAILSTVVSTAVTVGASYAIARLTAPPKPRPSDGRVEIKQPIPARFFTYGPCRVSGPVLLFESNGASVLFKIVAYGSRRIDSIQKFYVDGNDRTSLLDANGDLLNGRLVGGDYHLNIYTGQHLGDPAQTVDTHLDASWAGWTSAHRLRGIPYSYIRCDAGEAVDFSAAFPNGVPTVELVGGVQVYDPRKDSTNGGSGSHRMTNPATWEYSENQRLCTLDWLTWPDGYAKDWSRIDWATWVPQIALADQNVALKAGGTEKRYRVATRVSYDEPRSRVLHRLMEAGDQQLFVTADGLIGSRGGVWQAPTVDLNVGEMPEAHFTHGVPMMERVNEFELTCMMPDRGYMEVELQPWQNTTDPEWAAGIFRRVQLDLTQVPSHAQAQRLAKIYMAKRNPKWHGHVRTGFAGLNAIAEHAVNLTFDELEVGGPSFNGAYWIDGKISLLPDGTGVTFPVSAASAASYDWDAATEEKDPPAIPADVAFTGELGEILEAA